MRLRTSAPSSACVLTKCRTTVPTERFCDWRAVPLLCAPQMSPCMQNPHRPAKPSPPGKKVFEKTAPPRPIQPPGGDAGGSPCAHSWHGPRPGRWMCRGDAMERRHGSVPTRWFNVLKQNNYPVAAGDNYQKNHQFKAIRLTYGPAAGRVTSGKIGRPRAPP